MSADFMFYFMSELQWAPILFHAITIKNEPVNYIGKPSHIKTNMGRFAISLENSKNWQ
jgi:hypothetical protein